MDLNYPDFLGQASGSRSSSISGPTDPLRASVGDPLVRTASLAADSQSLSPNLPALDFDILLSLKLASLDARSVRSPFDSLNIAHNLSLSRFLPNASSFGNQTFDPFNLPTELQGGVGHISSRRPSYAAESFTRSGLGFRNSGHKNSLATLAATNNFNMNTRGGCIGHLTSSFENFSLNSNFNDFQQRRPSQIAAPKHSYYDYNLAHMDRAANQDPYMDRATNQDPFLGASSMAMGVGAEHGFGLNYNMGQQNGPNSPLGAQNAMAHNPMSQPQGNISLYSSVFPSNGNYGQVNVQGYVNTPPLAHQLSTRVPGSAPSHASAQNLVSSPNHGAHNPPPSAPHHLNHIHNGGQKFTGGPSSHHLGFQSPHKLDDGLMLRDQQLVALTELRALYSTVQPYFIQPELSNAVLNKLKTLHKSPVIAKLVAFVKNLNNLNFTHKMLCLVANKNGKLDLLLYPANTNLSLQKDDLVIVDGDRGKDMVVILDPAVPPNQAILFNFLKKQEHLKSLTITDNAGGTVVKGLRRNSGPNLDFEKNDDNEFVILLPTKQVLRFATPKEVYKLSGKFLEEKKAFVTCFHKIHELGLGGSLELINVEYQSDFKKLIFYYYANFKRIDFRMLIKELFKVYKTRIWLCAVLPKDGRVLYEGDTVRSADGWHPKGYKLDNETSAPNAEPSATNLVLGTTVDGSNSGQSNTFSSAVKQEDGIPPEYKLGSEQLTNFSVQTFKAMPEPTYFHTHNMLNLMTNLARDIEGHFYGFNAGLQPKA